MLLRNGLSFSMAVKATRKHRNHNVCIFSKHSIVRVASLSSLCSLGAKVAENVGVSNINLVIEENTRKLNNLFKKYDLEEPSEQSVNELQ